jgi:type IV pilus assembly protein PilA
MLATLRKRTEREDEGFTLIELMVVVLIIAILLAIAIPTFLGAQDRARDRAVQSNLRNSLTAAKTIATDDEGLFTNVSAASLNTAEASITHVVGVDNTAPAVDTVAVLQTGGTVLNLWAQSASGDFFGIEANSDGAVGFCKNASDDLVDVDCTVASDQW